MNTAHNLRPAVARKLAKIRLWLVVFAGEAKFPDISVERDLFETKAAALEEASLYDGQKVVRVRLVPDPPKPPAKRSRRRR